MFRIGIQTHTGGALGIDETYRLIRECGFDAVDAGLDFLQKYDGQRWPLLGQPGYTTEREYLEAVRPFKEAAKKYGLENYQSHAPFPTYVPDESGEVNAYLLEIMKKAIMCCDAIDCRRIVIHPFYLQYEHRLDAKTKWEKNIEGYSQLIPQAKKYGVTICLENMTIRNRGKKYEGVCATAAEANGYIDTLNGIAGAKCFAFCYDTGHALQISRDPREELPAMGERIECFHVHDNSGLTDQHLAPYMGVLDWDSFIDGLRAIRFNKTLCFETGAIWRVVARALCPDLMKFIARTGRRFAQRVAE